MEEVHAEPVPDAKAVQMPENETPEDVRKDAVPTPPETAEDSAKEPAYQVGDTVYLDDTAFIVEEIGLFDVQLRDPTLAYPIFRAESRERLERMLRADERNGVRNRMTPAATANTSATFTTTRPIRLRRSWLNTRTITGSGEVMAKA